jgi:hypothetical protein
VPLTVSRVASSFDYQMLGNLALEFGPEMHRKVFGGNQKQDSQPPSHNKKLYP